MSKKHRKSFGPAKPPVHESREDRARMLSGKTMNSKVRSEGQALAAVEKRALAQRQQSAFEAKIMTSKESKD
jgi:hypothetical protein